MDFTLLGRGRYPGGDITIEAGVELNYIDPEHQVHQLES